MIGDLSIFDCCMLGRVSDVVHFLDSGTQIDCRDARGRTPLMVACWAGRQEVVALLLARGASPNACNVAGTTPFMYAKSAALGSGDLTILEQLVDSGADLDARDNFGKTALDYARHNFDMIETFILKESHRR